MLLDLYTRQTTGVTLNPLLTAAGPRAPGVLICFEQASGDVISS